MVKTNSSFKLSKPVKRVLATFTDPVARNIYKQCMIEAAHSYVHNRHRRPIDKPKSSDSD